MLKCPVKFGETGVRKKVYYQKMKLQDKERLMVNVELYVKMLNFLTSCSTIFFFYSKKNLNYIHTPHEVSQIIFQTD